MKYIKVNGTELQCARICTRMYFTISKLNYTSTEKYHFFNIDDEMLYISKYADFGPLNLGHVFNYVKKVDRKLQSKMLRNKCIIHIASGRTKQWTNAAFLAAAYRTIKLHKNPEAAVAPLAVFKRKLRSFTVGDRKYKLSIQDFMEGLSK